MQMVSNFLIKDGKCTREKVEFVEFALENSHVGLKMGKKLWKLATQISWRNFWVWLLEKWDGRKFLGFCGEKKWENEGNSGCSVVNC